jgi:hypothetical protein
LLPGACVSGNFSFSTAVPDHFLADEILLAQFTQSAGFDPENVRWRVIARMVRKTRSVEPKGLTSVRRYLEKDAPLKADVSVLIARH